MTSSPAKRIAVTGGAGQIAQHLLFRIAHGDLLGKHQPIHLQILEIPEALPAVTVPSFLNAGRSFAKSSALTP